MNFSFFSGESCVKLRTLEVRLLPSFIYKQQKLLQLSLTILKYIYIELKRSHPRRFVPHRYTSPAYTMLIPPLLLWCFSSSLVPVIRFFKNTAHYFGIWCISFHTSTSHPLIAFPIHFIHFFFGLPLSPFPSILMSPMFLNRNNHNFFS